MPDWKAAAHTSVGLVRTRNEDAYLVMEEQSLFAVADGMGGHNRGDIAATLCVKAIEDWFSGRVTDEAQHRFRRFFQKTFGLSSLGEAELLGAIEFANRLIFETARGSAELQGMGTTLVAAYFHGSYVFIAYSGDSRAYRLRKGRLTQLTEDHSLLNEYLRLQMISVEDIPRFPFRNVIMKALGLSEKAPVDYLRRRTRPGDVYLLCSDGLTDMVSDEEIREALLAGGDLSTRCRRLVEMAEAAGGYDNITVVLIEEGRKLS